MNKYVVKSGDGYLIRVEDIPLMTNLKTDATIFHNINLANKAARKLWKSGYHAAIVILR